MRRYLHLMLLVVLGFAGPACETGNEPQILTLTGVVRDYFTGNALPNVALTFESRSTTSSATGAYRFDNLMPTEILFISGDLANYRTTRNEPVILGNSDVTADLAVVSGADADRQYTAVGASQVVGTAVVFVNLLNASGQPHTGIPIADIFIADTLDDPVGTGPFVFGSSGDIVSPATLNVTTAFNGRARVAVLNVPRGTYQLRVAYDDAGTPRVKTIQVVAADSGATLIRR